MQRATVDKLGSNLPEQVFKSDAVASPTNRQVPALADDTNAGLAARVPSPQDALLDIVSADYEAFLPGDDAEYLFTFSYFVFKFEGQRSAISTEYALKTLQRNKGLDDPVAIVELEKARFTRPTP